MRSADDTKDERHVSFDLNVDACGGPLSCKQIDKQQGHAASILSLGASVGREHVACWTLNIALRRLLRSTAALEYTLYLAGKAVDYASRGFIV